MSAKCGDVFFYSIEFIPIFSYLLLRFLHCYSTQELDAFADNSDVYFSHRDWQHSNATLVDNLSQCALVAEKSPTENTYYLADAETSPEPLASEELYENANSGNEKMKGKQKFIFI